MGQRLIHYDFWDATRRPIGRVHGAFYRQSTRHEEKIGALVANVVLALRSLGSVSAALTCIHYLHLGTLEEAQSLLDALIIVSNLRDGMTFLLFPTCIMEPMDRAKDRSTRLISGRLSPRATLRARLASCWDLSAPPSIYSASSTRESPASRALQSSGGLSGAKPAAGSDLVEPQWPAQRGLACNSCCNTALRVRPAGVVIGLSALQRAVSSMPTSVTSRDPWSPAPRSKDWDDAT
ncbi:hypothetical protein D8B26_002247 [Coccidioides posadasii str. Silveira]|uniref:uncharacterized protein n=1 Tax=Coccidioides posadasii (strain RMSCC 757 / Silveira) TaxID=443226 RepID=UPI001BF12263|nr:hypothetical protein D8B26_002247 [Coccidioides posadasii str. Silveira]